jgi:hypothetical protein
MVVNHKVIYKLVLGHHEVVGSVAGVIIWHPNISIVLTRAYTLFAVPFSLWLLCFVSKNPVPRWVVHHCYNRISVFKWPAWFRVMVKLILMF